MIKRRGAEFPKGGKGKGKGGKGKVSATQRNARNDDKEMGICFNYSRGNGYCKYAEACKFKHEGPKGGGRRRKAKTWSYLSRSERGPKEEA